MILLLIDGDAISHTACRTSKEHDEQGFVRDTEVVEAGVEGCLHSIFLTLEEKYEIKATHYKIFLGGSNNFRKIINPAYKQNRKDKEYPPLMWYAKKYMIDAHKAFVCNGVEADDTIAATHRYWLESEWLDIEKDLVIVCSFDKDMQTVPCVLFDTYHTRRELRIIQVLDSERFFFKQMLVGDAADNIFGIPKVGDKTADKILKDKNTSFGLFRASYSAYLKAFGRLARERWKLNYTLLKLVDTGIEIPLEYEELQ